MKVIGQGQGQANAVGPTWIEGNFFQFETALVLLPEIHFHSLSAMHAFPSTVYSHLLSTEFLLLPALEVHNSIFCRCYLLTTCYKFTVKSYDKEFFLMFKNLPRLLATVKWHSLCPIFMCHPIFAAC